MSLIWLLQSWGGRQLAGPLVRAETGDDFEGRSEYILVNWEMSAGLRSPFRETKTIKNTVD